MHAVGVIGVELQGFREALAATLVKDEADRPGFDAVFDRYFGAPGHQRGKGKHPQPSNDSQGRGTGKPGSAAAPREPQRPKEQPEQPRLTPFNAERELQQGNQNRGRKLARSRALLDRPFDRMSPPDVEACEALVADLAERFRAHASRRQRSAHRGCISIRRTLRKSISTGGVPIDPALRRRLPGRPDLVAFCDFSYSVITASKFLLALLAPAPAFFRRVRCFAYVDRPVEVSIEAGMVVPHGELDLYARSDFGKVLVEFNDIYAPLLTRNTVVLILGDARNNRRPARGDLLGRMHNAVRHVIWLNPESRVRWDTGDSVTATYGRHCDVVLSASNIHELYAGLQRAFRPAFR